ncbi:magnesium-translocating P-type ATPase [Streptomyces albiaxialis]|uniref:Magnesium-transporting ATPase, P-type 1 n=1 Tax=Streptomyces albiaxialis TaxID=329523 RepID=A0ABN2WRF1_9ACTN
MPEAGGRAPESAGPAPEAVPVPVAPDPVGPVPVADDGALPLPTPLQVLRSLESGPKGLTEERAEERLAAVGPNTLPARRTPSLPRRMARGLRDPFTSVLLCLGLVSAAVTSWGTALVILALVTVSCAVRTAGEHRADRSSAALRALVADTATVLRRTAEGRREPRVREVPVDELVPGDVIRLGPGDLVPADVLLLRASGLRVHQAPLTGESAPVAKHPPEDAPSLAEPGPGLFDRPHLCFQGSGVASGSGTAVVVATGADTQLAAGQAAARERGIGAFDRSVYGISWILIRFMLLTPPLVLMADAAFGEHGGGTLPFAVAVAVSLTPEMLPVVVTTVLARGGVALARECRVIVRRLPALHDLAAMDVLCVDKTGTVTQDRPVVDRALDAYGRDDARVLRWAALNAAWTLQLAELPAPDALDEALLDADADPCGEDEAYEGVTALPFDHARRLSTAVLRRPGVLGAHTLVVKGAVENVLERCALDEDARARVRALAARQAADGLRVLAVATATRTPRARDWTPADERGLALTGLVTFRDALASTAPDALHALRDRGIAVRLVTGDHPETAARAWHELGLDPRPGSGGLLTGERIDALSDEELAGAVTRTAVFARCAAPHKARIVTALRAAGHTTGFLGDGVNDLAALRAADVGLCPRDAVAVAREGADVVLGDKDLAAVARAVDAGRRGGVAIATYLRVALSSNLGNALAMLVAVLLLPFVPMLPAQVLAQNLCFDAAQLSFAFDRRPRAVPARPTALDPRELLRFLTRFGLLNALADLATFAVIALTAHSAVTGAEPEVFHGGWFTENLLTQGLVILLLRGGSGRVRGPVGLAAAGLGVLGVLIPFTPLGPALGTAPLPPVAYALLALVLGLYGCALAAARARYAARHLGGQP